MTTSPRVNAAGLKEQESGYLTILGFLITAIIVGFTVPQGIQSGAVFLIWFSICCTTGILLTNRWSRDTARRFLLRLFIAGFLIRVTVAGIIFFRTEWLYRDPSVLILPRWGHVDAAGLMQRASNLVSVWRSSDRLILSIPQLIEITGGLSQSYAIFNGFYLLIFGELGEFLPVVTNCALGALLPLLTFRMGQEFLNQRAGSLSAYFVAFDPLLIFYSALNLKEIPAAFLLTAVTVAYFELLQQVKLKKIVALTVLSVALVLVRIYVWIVLMLALFISGLFERRISLTKGNIRSLALLVVVLLVIIAVPQTQRFLVDDIIGRVTTGQLGEWSRGNVALAAERGFFIGQFRANSAFRLAITAAHYLISPSPYRMRLAISDLTKLGMIFWGTLFPYFVFGFLYSIRHRGSKAWPMVVFVVGLVAAYAPFPVQASVRHRVQMMPFAYLITGLGITDYQHRHKKGMTLLMWVGVFVSLTLFEFMF